MAPDRLRDGDANRVQGKGGRASKARAALAKIIEVISTIPPPSFLTVESKTKASVAADAGLKLAMEGDDIVSGGTDNSSASLVIDPIPRDDDVAMEDDDDDLISPLSGDAPRRHQNSSEGECNRKEDEKKGDGEISGGEEEEEEEMNPDQGEWCKGGSTSSARKEENNNNDDDDKGGSKEGYLDLLLEAVQHELPLDQDEEEEQGKGVQERSEEVNRDTDKGRVGHRSCWSQKSHLYSEESAAAPVARSKSKRGIRKQTLPSRYRDSVLQPWAKPPTLHRHR